MFLRYGQPQAGEAGEGQGELIQGVWVKPVIRIERNNQPVTGPFNRKVPGSSHAVIVGPDAGASRVRTQGAVNSGPGAVRGAIINDNEPPVAESLHLDGADGHSHVFFCIIAGDNHRYEHRLA